MTKIEIITHPSVQSAINTFKNLEINFIPEKTEESKRSFVEQIIKDGYEVLSFENDKLILDRPLKKDNENRIWFEVDNGFVKKISQNINEILSEADIENSIENMSTTILGLKVKEISKLKQYDLDTLYSWVLVYDNGDLSVIGAFPSERINSKELLTHINTNNEVSKKKIVSFEAILR